MGLEISHIQDNNLKSAAMIADSKKLGGNNDKKLSSNEIPIFSIMASNNECPNEDINEISRQVIKNELKQKAGNLERNITKLKAEIAAGDVSQKTIDNKKKTGRLIFGAGIAAALFSLVSGVLYIANTKGLNKVKTNCILGGGSLLIGGLLTAMITGLKFCDEARELGKQKYVILQKKDQLEKLKQELEETKYVGDVANLQFATQGDIKPNIVEKNKVVDNTKNKKAQNTSVTFPMSREEFNSIKGAATMREDCGYLYNYGTQGLIEGETYLFFKSTQDREEYVRMVIDNNSVYMLSEKSHNNKYNNITDINNKEYSAITSEYNERYREAQIAGKSKAELDAITKERIQKQEAAKQKRIKEQTEEKNARISDMAKKAAENDKAKREAQARLGVKVYTVEKK